MRIECARPESRCRPGMQHDAGMASSGMVAADSGTRAPDFPACQCKETNECCDGCQPLNEGGACKPDGYGCTLEVCRMGACVHEERKDRCFADGLCHQAGDPHLTNKCLVCDPSRNHRGWTPRDFGTACGNGNYCDREDHCDGSPQAGVCLHIDPCAGLTCDGSNGMLSPISPTSARWLASSSTAADSCSEIVAIGRCRSRRVPLDLRALPASVLPSPAELMCLRLTAFASSALVT
jgi:hypothetical protein